MGKEKKYFQVPLSINCSKIALRWVSSVDWNKRPVHLLVLWMPFRSTVTCAEMQVSILVRSRACEARYSRSEALRRSSLPLNRSSSLDSFSPSLCSPFSSILVSLFELMRSLCSSSPLLTSNDSKLAIHRPLMVLALTFPCLTIPFWISLQNSIKCVPVPSSNRNESCPSFFSIAPPTTFSTIVLLPSLSIASWHCSDRQSSTECLSQWKANDETSVVDYHSQSSSFRSPDQLQYYISSVPSFRDYTTFNGAYLWSNESADDSVCDCRLDNRDRI